MSALQNNITRFDLLQINRDVKKLCRCPEPKYVLDTQNRFVHCKYCNGIVDPFDALCKIARHYERYAEQTEAMREERRKIDKYKPHLISIKRLEQDIGKNGEMVPHCPHCKRPFEISELTSFTNRRFIGGSHE